MVKKTKYKKGSNDVTNVAVILSKGWGTPWGNNADARPELRFEPRIARIIDEALSRDLENPFPYEVTVRILDVLKEDYPRELKYIEFEDLSNLTIVWVREGTEFRIQDNSDGEEWVIDKVWDTYLTA